MAAAAITEKNRGIALLVAVIFTSVMLAFGVLIGSLGYKQTLLAQSVKESQHAFYAADTGMECLLYADQAMNDGKGVFADDDGIPLAPDSFAGTFECDGNRLDLRMGSYTVGSVGYSSASASVDLTGGRCVDLSIYKPIGGIGKTWIFSQGYSVNCATAGSVGGGGKRFSSRGMRAHY